MGQIRHNEVELLKTCVGNYKLDGDIQIHEYFAVLALWKIADTIFCLQFEKERIVSQAIKALEDIERTLPEVTATQYTERCNNILGHLRDLTALMRLSSEKLSKSQSESSIGALGLNIVMAASCAIDAMDAVCYAEQLHETQQVIQKTRQETAEKLDDQTKAKASLRAQELNVKRHAASKKAKELLRTQWTTRKREFKSAAKAADYYREWMLKNHPEYDFEQRWFYEAILEFKREQNDSTSSR